MNIRSAFPTDFPSIATLVHQHCQDPVTQCIQSSGGESTKELIGEMNKYHESGEMLWSIALDGERLLAAAGCEFEAHGSRGWLRGPFAVGDWENLAPKVYDHLWESLPSRITRLDSFLNDQNLRGQRFYEARGFEEKSRAHVYTASHAEQPAFTPKVTCNPLDERHHIGFDTLHNAVFPHTFYTGEQIIALLDGDHRVWVSVEGQDVLGYIYAAHEPFAEEGYIEFLGVRADSQGKGIGGALISRALDWFFTERNLDTVGLTVDDSNTNARGLYERVGFKLRYTGVNQRLESGDSL